eukprot:649384-Pyramimonas_sp.AAC.1
MIIPEIQRRTLNLNRSDCGSSLRRLTYCRGTHDGGKTPYSSTRQEQEERCVMHMPSHECTFNRLRVTSYELKVTRQSLYTKSKVDLFKVVPHPFLITLLRNTTSLSCIAQGPPGAGGYGGVRKTRAIAG